MFTGLLNVQYACQESALRSQRPTPQASRAVPCRLERRRECRWRRLPLASPSAQRPLNFGRRDADGARRYGGGPCPPVGEAVAVKGKPSCHFGRFHGVDPPCSGRRCVPPARSWRLITTADGVRKVAGPPRSLRARRPQARVFVSVADRDRRVDGVPRWKRLADPGFLRCAADSTGGCYALAAPWRQDPASCANASKVSDQQTSQRQIDAMEAGEIDMVIEHSVMAWERTVVRWPRHADRSGATRVSAIHDWRRRGLLAAV